MPVFGLLEIILTMNVHSGILSLNVSHLLPFTQRVIIPFGLFPGSHFRPPLSKGGTAPSTTWVTRLPQDSSRHSTSFRQLSQEFFGYGLKQPQRAPLHCCALLLSNSEFHQILHMAVSVLFCSPVNKTHSHHLYMGIPCITYALLGKQKDPQFAKARCQI